MLIEVGRLTKDVDKIDCEKFINTQTTPIRRFYDKLYANYMQIKNQSITKNAVIIKHAINVWKNRGMVEGLNNALIKLDISYFPFTTLNPAGVCIHELAATIKNADNVTLIATIIAETRNIL